MPNPINRQLFMQQLSGLDAAFVHQDTRRTPMHVTAVLIYDVGSVSGSSVQRADLHRLLAGNLNRFALFRRRLQRVPLDLDTPYWVDVRNPDWDQHLAEISCDPAGDWQGFQHLLTGLHNRGLDLSRPLWEMCLVHGVNDLPGLPPRCQALVLKFHHSVIDGMSLAAIVDTMHQDEMPASGDDAKDRPAPRYSDMWTRFSINTMDRQIKFAETMSKLMPGVLRASLKQDRFSDLPAVLATRAHFNNAVGTAKTTGFVLWPREEFLVIRRAVRRVTLNDIALSIVSGALREYLKSHAQLPAKSLACGVPINLRGPATRPGGNSYATMRVGLATSIADPVERLRFVHRYAVAGKKQIGALGTGTIMDISDSVSPNILAGGIRAMAQASRIADVPVPFHTMVSNVPGPTVPMRLGDAELVVPIGFGPVRDNMGLFHILSGSRGMVSLTFTACARLMPDGEHYQQCLHNACSDLSEQTLR
jgi:WS/DGAT/MGAT family acyltransferase